jgi:hypothetical protein
LENGGKEDKESVEEEIVQLMENKNPKIRKRAKDIHNLMY